MKINILYLCVALFSVSFNSYGQNQDSSDSVAVEPVYAVDDLLLQEKTGRLLFPDVNPAYKGGIEALKKYFEEHSLRGEAEDAAFRVHIYFLVDKDGQAKDFDLVTRVEPRSPQKQRLLNWGIEVLLIVSQMPQQWTPATVDGVPVDCYQILSFTVIEGRLHQVIAYR